MCNDVRDNGPLPKELAVEMFPVVRRIAYRLAKRLPSHVCIDDLISAGTVGLVTAYRRFDPALGDDFRAYAELRIRGAMIDELRAADPLTRELRAHANRTRVAKLRLESALGRAANDTETADELGLSLASYQAFSARAAVGPTVSLDAPTTDGMMLEVTDLAETPADERLVREQSMKTVRGAIEALPPRLRQVIEFYYGDERTLRDIGIILGVTESRVCQMQSEAVQKMRAHVTLTEPIEARPSMRRAPRLPRHAAQQRLRVAA
ncbi:MAG: FliA/WhiG family RNA polymerase sigma factor [Byssovorax sp.]